MAKNKNQRGDEIKFKVPKGVKSELYQRATAMNMTMAEYIRHKLGVPQMVRGFYRASPETRAKQSARASERWQRERDKSEKESEK